MPDIFFSIVVPTYNRASLIFETLDCFFLQSYKNFEVIIVDDCSTDNTAELLQPLIRESKIRYILNEKNSERAFSRNVGMAHAKGDYLTVIDSDDFMYKDCLSDAVTFILANPGIKVFHNKFEIVNQQREVIYHIKYPSLQNQYKALCNGNFMSSLSCFIHREVYTQYKFNLDPKMTGSEDYEYWFQVFARYKVGRIDKINSAIREHPHRSVNIDAYDHLEYQRKAILEVINKDNVIKEKFEKYTGRLSASFTLQQIIVNYANYSFSKKMKLLYTAAKYDGSVLFTKRFLSTAVNIFIK